jgi:hypothetical protein
MDLGQNWEKKALIALAVIIIIVVIYVYNPFVGKPDTRIQDQNPTPITQPTLNTGVNNSAQNNTTTNITIEGNGTFQISPEQAKTIASQNGYSVGDPTIGNVNINNETVSVWIVPLLKDNIVAKKVYINSVTGMIVGTEEVK